MSVTFRFCCVLLGIDPILFCLDDLIESLGLIVSVVFPQADSLEIIIDLWLMLFFQPILEACAQATVATNHMFLTMISAVGLFMLFVATVFGLANVLSRNCET